MSLLVQNQITLDNNDKPTRYFFKKEKSLQNRKQIGPIIQDNNILETQSDIEKHCMDFYQKLYTKYDIDNNLKYYFQNNIPKVNEGDKEILDSPLTYDACLLAINQMNNNKTPGNDGLPAEFYKYFHIYGKDFVKMINKTISNSALPKL